MKKTLFTTLFAGFLLFSCNNTPGSNISNKSADITGEWNITTVNGLSTDSVETMPFINFTDSGTVNGNASVNLFFGRYTVNADTLLLTEMGATMMSAEDMEIEMAIMQALSQTVTFALQDSIISVKDAEGATILTLERK
jgi:heat shock protein HslJ